jgi:hypothetical protein
MVLLGQAVLLVLLVHPELVVLQEHLAQVVLLELAVLQVQAVRQVLKELQDLIV